MQIFNRRSKKMSLRKKPNEVREPAMRRSEDRENETGNLRNTKKATMTMVESYLPLHKMERSRN